MKIHTIITHEYPDFDCLYATYLLKKFGKVRYEGIEEAQLRFVPAGSLPADKTGDAWVQEGCLTLDLEGGTYDHHGASDDAEYSTAHLVARDLGVDRDPCLEKILSFIDMNDLQGIGLQSRQAVDHLISIPNIIRGLNLRYRDNYSEVYRVCEELFEAAYLNEREWYQALDDIQEGRSHRMGNFKILSFRSGSTASAKAGRFRQADLCIIQGTSDSLNITTRKSKRWPSPDLTKLARIVRLAEAKRAGEEIDKTQLGQPGVMVHWFLHQSRCFLSRGSFKNTQVPPTQLALDELHQLAIFCFDPQPKYLGVFDQDYDEFRSALRKSMRDNLRA